MKKAYLKYFFFYENLRIVLGFDNLKTDIFLDFERDSVGQVSVVYYFLANFVEKLNFFEKFI